jgi:hypothetical protein
MRYCYRAVVRGTRRRTLALLVAWCLACWLLLFLGYYLVAAIAVGAVVLGGVGAGAWARRADPLAHLRPGDPESCSAEAALGAGPCGARHPKRRLWCTRGHRHRGQHIAGTGYVVVAVWPARSEITR